MIIKYVNTTEWGGRVEKQMFIRKRLDRAPLGNRGAAWKRVFDEEHRWVSVPVCAHECVFVCVHRGNGNERETHQWIIFVQAPVLEVYLWCWRKQTLLSMRRRQLLLPWPSLWHLRTLQSRQRRALESPTGNSRHCSVRMLWAPPVWSEHDDDLQIKKLEK